MNTQPIRRWSAGLVTSAWVAATVLAPVLLPASGQAAETASSIARGGLLYDKWYKVIGVDEPQSSHPLYPEDKKYAKKPGSNWRCKECHGWDYLGKDGAYASGKHNTGIVGIQGMKGADPADVVTVLTSDAHGYGDKLNDQDLQVLAMFVSQGQVDMDAYIDRASKAPKGDGARGEAYFNTICAKCHGKDGLSPDDMPPLGSLMGNPWEVMHKVLNGQPDENMPALRALDWQIAADILAHVATLPAER